VVMVLAIPIKLQMVDKNNANITTTSFSIIVNGSVVNSNSNGTFTYLPTQAITPLSIFY
jgi:hypothetical protein